MRPSPHMPNNIIPIKHARNEEGMFVCDSASIDSVPTKAYCGSIKDDTLSNNMDFFGRKFRDGRVRAAAAPKWTSILSLDIR